jgi:hypothetical protein
MTTATPVSSAPRTTRRQRLLLAVALALFATAGYLVWRHFYRPGISVETVANRPLLKRESGEFYDPEVGLRFTVPTNWSMQARTAEAPDRHLKERMLVKYKRLLLNQSTAWLRVYVSDVTDPNKSVVEAVESRNPGTGFRLLSKVKSQTIAGLPAARISYSGYYSGVLCARDVIGVQHKDRIFYFVASYPAADKDAHQQTLQTIESVVFDQ